MKLLSRAVSAATMGITNLNSPTMRKKIFLFHLFLILSIYSISGQTRFSSYFLPNRHFLRTVKYSGNLLDGAAMYGMEQDYDWNGNLTRQFIYSTANSCRHNDIHLMQNGNVLLIVYEVKTPAQVVAAGCSQNITMWPEIFFHKRSYCSIN
jgi:hypothetical protein